MSGDAKLTIMTVTYEIVNCDCRICPEFSD